VQALVLKLHQRGGRSECAAAFGAETVSCMGGLCKLDLIVVICKASFDVKWFRNIFIYIRCPVSDRVVLQMLV
jgi:hypothetical protein